MTSRSALKRDAGAVTLRMQKQKAHGTSHEMALRRAVDFGEYCYRVQLKVPEMPWRTIDFAFLTAGLAIFLNDCFWRGRREHGSIPNKNERFWREKLQGIRKKDVKTTAHHGETGWTILRFWEYEAIAKIMRELTDILDVVSARQFFVLRERS